MILWNESSLTHFWQDERDFRLIVDDQMLVNAIVETTAEQFQKYIHRRPYHTRRSTSSIERSISRGVRSIFITRSPEFNIVIFFYKQICKNAFIRR